MIENGVIRRPKFYSMKKLPAEQREIIPGAAYSTLRLCAIIGDEAYDKLLANGLRAKRLNGSEYWYLSEDIVAAMAKCPEVNPSKRGRSRYVRVRPSKKQSA